MLQMRIFGDNIIGCKHGPHHFQPKCFNFDRGANLFIVVDTRAAKTKMKTNQLPTLDHGGIQSHFIRYTLMGYAPVKTVHKLMEMVTPPKQVLINQTFFINASQPLP